MRAPRRFTVSLVRASVRLRIKELDRPSAMATLAGIPACVCALRRCDCLRVLLCDSPDFCL